MSKPTVVILDGNNLSFGYYASFKDKSGGLLTSSTGVPTTVIFGMMRSLQAFTEHTAVDKTIVAWDVGGGSKWRKSIFPHYKGNRKGVYNDMQDYFDELVSARAYLESFGITQVPCKGVEADDVIGWFAHKYKRIGYKVIIYSNDKDYYQLVDKNCKIWRPIKEEFVGKEEVHERCSMAPKDLYKRDALIGQPKDNIPGICDLDEDGVIVRSGFGPAKAHKLLYPPNCDWTGPSLSLKDIHILLKEGGAPVNEKFRDQLLKNWGQVKLSAKLARIRTRNKHYSDWELKKLKKLFKLSRKKLKVRTKDVIMLAENLDIRRIDVPFICRRAGVKLVGKGRMKTGKVKL